MRIRSITGFFDPGWPLDPKRVGSMAACLSAGQEALTELGYEVQTLRVATPTPAEMERPVPVTDRLDLARRLEAECFLQGIDYASIGPALPDDPEGYEEIPEILAGTANIFASTLFADPAMGISLPAVRASARIIHACAKVSADGFTNLRFAALANVPPGSPFFPAAYHRQGQPALSIALEAANLAVDAIIEANSLSVARRRLVEAIESQAGILQSIVEPIAAEHEVRWLGIDFSLAPFPEDQRSLGAAMEALGLHSVGQAGSLAAAAFIADCIDQAQFERSGFCGLMMPVLEDSVLAKRAAEGTLTITDLMLYATVCGTGLDTIPLPGDTSVESIAALLIDLGAIALRHNKPLTARLMPLPGKAAGDPVHFDFPFFADSRVMDLGAESVHGLLAGQDEIDIGPRSV